MGVARRAFVFSRALASQSLPIRSLAGRLTLRVSGCYKSNHCCFSFGGAVAQLGARLDGIEEVVGSNPIGSTNELVGASRFHREGRGFESHRLHQ